MNFYIKIKWRKYWGTQYVSFLKYEDWIKLFVNFETITYLWCFFYFGAMSFNFIFIQQI